MPNRILLIQGHPDPAGGHFGHALADAYARGAESVGHDVIRVNIAALDFSLLQSKAEWDKGECPASLKPAQDALLAADHVVIYYPLWLGAMPALLKGFLEQVMRPGVAMSFDSSGRWVKHLKGKSARVVVTMGMPALAYRWFFRAHSLKSLERNILKFTGINPVRETLVGMVEGMKKPKAQRWLAKLESLGRHAA